MSPVCNKEANAEASSKIINPKWFKNDRQNEPFREDARSPRVKQHLRETTKTSISSILV